jgi:hypothetical protein
MFKAFLNDEGKKIWGSVFPDGLVPIKSPIPHQADLGGGASQEPVYIVAWDELTPIQRGQIINNLAVKFRAPPSAVEKQILEKGMPLRASLINATSIPNRFLA